MRSSRRKSAEGASAVEFALILPLLIVLVFGIIQFGIAFNRSQGMHAASREGARIAAVGGSVADIQARVQSAVQGTTVDPADVTVSVRRYADGADPSNQAAGSLVSSGTPCDGGGSASTVRVDAVVTGSPGKYAISIPLLPTWSQTFPSNAIFRCED